MIESTINSIFPTPIYMSKLDRKLTPLELKFVDKHKKDFYKNDGNITSNNNYILNIHPECKTHNYDEIAKLCVVTRNPDGIIIDPLHRTIPVLTKYEKAS